ncbi:MAG TPA: hypothetical protein VG204_23125 [Terriglobia bacterium]|nr:hypothetical protein [Terriglobia bacterium]
MGHARHTVYRALIVVAALGLPSSSTRANSTVVGVAVAVSNSSIDGAALQSGRTIVSGDDLQVQEGTALVAIGSGSHMLFGPDTAASFERTSDEVTAVVARGNVTLYQPHNEAVHLRVKVDDLFLAPAAGDETLGEVAVSDGSLYITTKQGLLRLEEGGSTMDLPKGKWIRLVHSPRRSAQLGRGSSGRSSLEWVAAGGASAAAVLAGLALYEVGGNSNTNSSQTANPTACTLDVLFGTTNPPSPFVPQTGSCP